MGEVKRTRSLASLPSISYDRYGDMYYKTDTSTAHSYNVNRSLSVPDFYGAPTWRYQGSPYRIYYPETDLWSDYTWERRYYSRPLYFPYSSWPNRRYYGLDPPWHLWWNYPSLGYIARYSQYGVSDLVDPFYWRRYRDPYYERPLWYPYRPWFYETIANERGADMCRRGSITLDTYRKYWLWPNSWESKHYFDFGSYRPLSWYRSPRRYYFNYNVL